MFFLRHKAHLCSVLISDKHGAVHLPYALAAIADAAFIRSCRVAYLALQHISRSRSFEHAYLSENQADL